MKLIIRREVLPGFGLTLLGVSLYLGSRKLNINYHQPTKRGDRQFHWSVGGKN